MPLGGTPLERSITPERAADGIAVTRWPTCAVAGCERPATWRNGVTWKNYCARHFDEGGLFEHERWPLIVTGTPGERALRDIAAVPQSDFPNGLARYTLIELAQRGVEVDIYPNQRFGWIVWLRPARPDMEGRHPIAEWMRDWASLSSEALARQAWKESEVA